MAVLCYNFSKIARVILLSIPVSMSVLPTYRILLDTENLYVVTLVNLWRQKQYFEQRKQQQQQQTAGSESYADGMNACGEHHKEQRSLDILSLLNLSTVSQECYSASPSGKYINILSIPKVTGRFSWVCLNKLRIKTNDVMLKFHNYIL